MKGERTERKSKQTNKHDKCEFQKYCNIIVRFNQLSFEYAHDHDISELWRQLTLVPKYHARKPFAFNS